MNELKKTPCIKIHMVHVQSFRLSAGSQYLNLVRPRGSILGRSQGRKLKHRETQIEMMPSFAICGHHKWEMMASFQFVCVYASIYSLLERPKFDSLGLTRLKPSQTIDKACECNLAFLFHEWENRS